MNSIIASDVVAAQPCHEKDYRKIQLVFAARTSSGLLHAICVCLYVISLCSARYAFFSLSLSPFYFMHRICSRCRHIWESVAAAHTSTSVQCVRQRRMILKLAMPRIQTELQYICDIYLFMGKVMSAAVCHKSNKPANNTYQYIVLAFVRVAVWGVVCLMFVCVFFSSICVFVCEHNTIIMKFSVIQHVFFFYFICEF